MHNEKGRSAKLLPFFYVMGERVSLHLSDAIMGEIQRSKSIVSTVPWTPGYCSFMGVYRWMSKIGEWRSEVLGTARRRYGSML